MNNKIMGGFMNRLILVFNLIFKIFIIIALTVLMAHMNKKARIFISGQ